ELAEWVGPLRELAGSSSDVWVMFNNNGRSTDVSSGREIAQAPENALEMLDVLKESGVPVAAAREGGENHRAAGEGGAGSVSPALRRAATLSASWPRGGLSARLVASTQG